MKDEAKLLSARDAAKLLSVSSKTVRRWIRTGFLPAVKMGQAYRVRESVVRATREKGLSIA